MSVEKLISKKVQQEIATTHKIKAIRESELFAKNIILIDNIDDGFANYEYLLLSGDKSAYEEFIQKSMILNGATDAYADFYYSRLTEEEKTNFRQSIHQEDLKYIYLTDWFEGIYFPLTEELMKFLLMVTANEILFSTFYFTKYPSALWGNYQLKFPMFFKDIDTKKLYQELAVDCGLLVERSNI